MSLWIAVLVLSCCTPAPGAPAPYPQPAEVTSGMEPEPDPLPSAGPPEALSELHVRCEEPARCPQGVAMLVGPASEIGRDGQPNRCTGALVASNRILTASHCLPVGSRRVAASCRGTWIVFPAAGGAPEEWVECDRVLIAAAVDDREVLRPDVAVVQLARAVGRSVLAVDPTPPAPHAIIEVVSITPHPIYRTQHALGTRLCRVRTTDEARALFGENAARVGWLSDCPTYAGNSGAPILDREGRVRGILHGGSGPWPGIGVTTPPPPAGH